MKSVVIGAGAMGRRHLKAITLVKDLEVCGISDLRAESLAKAVDEGFPEAWCHLSTETMLDTVCPDLVVVSTTAPSHASLAKLAIEKGVKYVIVEKPFCSSLREARELRSLADGHRVRMAVNHSVMFDERYIFLRNLASSNGFGSLVGITITGGNMGVAMNGSHMFELFRFVSGQVPHLVSAWFTSDSQPNPRGREFHDAAGQIRLENAAGQHFYIDIDPGHGHGDCMVMNFRNAQVMVDFLSGQAWINRRKQEFLDLPTTRYAMPFEMESQKIPGVDIVTNCAKLYHALISGKDIPDAQIGERVQRTLVAAYISNENGHMPVDIFSNLPEDRVFPWA